MVMMMVMWQIVSGSGTKAPLHRRVDFMARPTHVAVFFAGPVTLPLLLRSFIVSFHTQYIHSLDWLVGLFLVHMCLLSDDVLARLTVEETFADLDVPRKQMN